VRVTTAAGAQWEPGPPGRILGDAGERHWRGAVPGHDFTDASIQPIDPATGNHVDW
jgi:hypothetical protein